MSPATTPSAPARPKLGAKPANGGITPVERSPPPNPTARSPGPATTSWQPGSTPPTRRERTRPEPARLEEATKTEREVLAQLADTRARRDSLPGREPARDPLSQQVDRLETAASRAGQARIEAEAAHHTYQRWELTTAAVRHTGEAARTELARRHPPTTETVNRWAHQPSVWVAYQSILAERSLAAKRDSLKLATDTSRRLNFRAGQHRDAGEMVEAEAAQTLADRWTDDRAPSQTGSGRPGTPDAGTGRRTGPAHRPRPGRRGGAAKRVTRPPRPRHHRPTRSGAARTHPEAPHTKALNRHTVRSQSPKRPVSTTTGADGPMFRKKRQADQQAWEAWQWIAQQHARNRPLSESSWRHPLELVGQVTNVYMLARDGTKAIVDFGPTGRWDTWWPHSRPNPASGSQSTAGYGHHRGPTPDAKCAGFSAGNATSPPDTPQRAHRNDRRLRKAQRRATSAVSITPG